MKLNQNLLNAVVMVLTLALTVLLWYVSNRVAAGEMAIELEAPPGAADYRVPIVESE